MPLYEDSAQKAEENKSSAYMLLFFGIAGMVVVVLGITGVLPFQLSGASKYMTYGVMSALFVLFIVMGLVSMKSYHFFAVKAESENTLRSTIEKWCLDTLKPEKLDEEIYQMGEAMLKEVPDEALSAEVSQTEASEGEGDEEIADNSEEIIYYRRTELMKEKINKQFMNLDEAFVDAFVDGIYSEIFKEN